MNIQHVDTCLACGESAASVFVIATRGREHRYATREEAERVASAIFDASGVVVGITEEGE